MQTITLFACLIAIATCSPSGIWGGHAGIRVVPAGPTTLVGASGVVGPNGAAGPAGVVNGHGAVGPNGIPNAIGHGGVLGGGLVAGLGWGHDDGQWHGEGLLESQDLVGHGAGIIAPGIVAGHGLGLAGLGIGHGIHW